MALVTTRGTAKTLAKTLLDEKSDTFFSQTNQDNLVDEANRIVWRELINTNYEFFLETATLTFTANSERVDLTATTTEIPYKLIDVGSTPNAGGISPSNPFTQWRPMRFPERNQIQNQFNALRATSSYHFVMVGEFLYVAPIPTTALNVQLFYISPLAALVSNGTKLLGGKAHNTFGDAVGYCLANLMNSKQQGQNPVIDRLWMEAQTRINDHATSRNANEGGHVRVTRASWE